MSLSRVGSANSFDSSLRNIAQRQLALVAQQDKLTAGKKVVNASDDPTSAANAERALTRISRIAADSRALESQRNAITMAESTLGDITDALQNFRELVVSAGNGVNSNAERKSIALALQGMRDQVVSLANKSDTNGLPLFSALGSALTPFVGPQASAPDYTFKGLPGQNASSDVAIPIALDGNSAFMFEPARDQTYHVALSVTAPAHALSSDSVSVSNAALVSGDSYTVTVSNVDTSTSPGNTIVSYSVSATPSGTSGSFSAAPYPSSQSAHIALAGMAGLSLNLSGTPSVGDSLSVTPSPSIFSVLDKAIQDIGGATDSNTASQAVRMALNNIDIGMARVSAVRGQAGDLLNRAERIAANQEKRSVQLEADRSRAEDLDMVSGISEFNNLNTGYQAALQTYAKVEKLSLFNFMA